ncbi:copper-binding protein [Massilia phosphatilytica]
MVWSVCPQRRQNACSFSSLPVWSRAMLYRQLAGVLVDFLDLAIGQHHAAPAASQDDANALTDGEVKKVDKDTGKLTVQHGPLTNLNMPGMTMSFKVQDPAMLDQVKTGDKIRLRVERINGTFTVTKLEAAN